MASRGATPAPVSRPGLSAIAGADGERTVVQIWGEHDVATVAALSVTISLAVARSDGGLVLDLSGVDFMDAATVGVIVRTRMYLHAQARSLQLRSPSNSALRVIDLCGLTDLLDRRGGDRDVALGSWESVPTTERAAQAVAPSRQPAERTRNEAARGAP